MANLEVAKPVTIGWKDCADWFAQANSGEQVRFFLLVAQHAQKWDSPACFQWAHIGNELRDGLGTEEVDLAATMLREIVGHMDHKSEAEAA